MKAPFNNIERTPYYIQRGRNGSSYMVCNSIGIVMAIFQDPMDAEVYLSLKNGKLAMVPREILQMARLSPLDRAGSQIENIIIDEYVTMGKEEK